jgi:hypothetical protein
VRIVLTVLVSALLAAAIVVVTRDDSGSDADRTEQVLRDVQRQTAGAYGCMPPAVRNRFDRLSERYNARFERIVDRAPEGADSAAIDRALRADAGFVRLANRTKGLLVRYLPGGSDYDAACYSRAIKRYDRSVAAQQ